MSVISSIKRLRPGGSDIVVAICAMGAVALLVRLGMGLTFYADEWSVITDRSVTLPDLLRPFNEHWLAGMIVAYRSVFAIVGMHSYVPYLTLLAVLHAVVGILIYALVRRRTLRPVAVGITVVVLFFGSGFENLFWGMQIGFIGAAALGFAALLVVDDASRPSGVRRALTAAVLLTLAVMTSGYGLFMLALVGWDLLVDPRRRRWIWPLLLPVVVWGTWYLALGRTGIATHGNPFTLDRLAAVPGFVLDGFSAAFGAAVGGGAITGPVIAVATMAWIVYIAARGHPLPRRSIACLLAIATLYAVVGLVRAQFEIAAEVYSRYTYLSGMLALICIASLIGRPAIPSRQLPRALGVGLLVFTVSLGWNGQLLVAGRALFAERADLTRALLTIATTDPLPAGVDPRRSLVLVPSPVEVRRIIAAYGSPLTDDISPGSVGAVPASTLDDARHEPSTRQPGCLSRSVPPSARPLRAVHRSLRPCVRLGRDRTAGAYRLRGMPRQRRLRAFYALVAALLAIVFAVEVRLLWDVLTAQNALGADLVFFQDIARHWRDTGEFYLQRQLSGPYVVETLVDVLYPPLRCTGSSRSCGCLPCSGGRSRSRCSVCVSPACGPPPGHGH